MSAKLPEPVYLYDAAIDAELDLRLRLLLTLCFRNTYFVNQRFRHQVPMHRWLMFDERGMPIAHVAVHDKWLRHPDALIPAGGVAEVCVHPDWRGQKLYRQLLHAAHDWMRGRGMHFSLLFGNPALYTPLGYARVETPVRLYSVSRREWAVCVHESLLVRPFGKAVWPAGEPVDLDGPKF
jgi:predicted N-acetyltransferase YhbS